MNVIRFEEQEGMGCLDLITALNKTPTKIFIQNSEFLHAFEDFETINIVYMKSISTNSRGAR